ncbi:unnamed protein product [Candidula unifasciata]|uniref:Dehydrogenase/reductase SDR family member 7 n=1 Tax=Candidula unifasciata TaxID=100452 RepID=A0A8S4A243_9EUPU|nr:unnamed protein product [Candidula unifasciata]
MLCLLLASIPVVAFLVTLTVIIALTRLDADLLLALYAKFGNQPASLKGKVVWITGASSGIGEYIALCLAEAGCRLVLSARREQLLEKVKERCLLISKGKLSEDDIMVFPLDVVDYESHKPAVQNVLEKFNKIDILINNAGKSQRSPWVDVELCVDRELFEINVLGSVSLTQHVLPHMMERKQGHIVVMSSIAGLIGAPHSRSYTGAKHALHGYFDCLRTEMIEHKIDVTILCPGPVHSNLFIEAATGKKGEMMGKADNLKDKKMMTDRCAYLSCVAIANKQFEAWITEHPFLGICYMNQYSPLLSFLFLKIVGVKRLMKMREGQ